MSDTGTDLATVDETDAELAELGGDDIGAAIRLHEERETNLEVATHSIEAAAQALTGMRLWRLNDRGQRECALIYDIRNRGKGPTVRCMNALVAARGNFETTSIESDESTLWSHKMEGEEKVVEQVACVESRVTVLDRLTNNIHMGVSRKAFFQRRSKDKGGGWYATPGDPAAVSEAIALRKAQEKHFAGVLDALKAIILQEFQSGRDWFSGVVPEGDKGGEDSRAAMLAAREAKGALPVGRARAQAFVESVKELDAQLEGEPRQRLRDDWRAYQAMRCPNGLTDAPAKILAEAEAMLDEWREALLGESKPEIETEAASETTEPEPAPTVEAPTEQALRALWKETDLTKAEIAAIYKAAGIKLDADLDPETCRALWDATEATFEAGTEAAQASLGLDADDDGDGDDEGGDDHE